MLSFTAEEAWLARDPSATSVHLELFPSVPQAWRDTALAEKWRPYRSWVSLLMRSDRERRTGEISRRR